MDTVMFFMGTGRHGFFDWGVGSANSVFAFDLLISVRLLDVILRKCWVEIFGEECG
jgi:hypothetical protein